MSNTPAPAAPVQPEDDLAQLLAYAHELGLGDVTRDNARKLLARVGQLNLAKRKLRDRRARLDRSLERTSDQIWRERLSDEARARHEHRSHRARVELAQLRAQRPLLERLQTAFMESATLPGESTPEFVHFGKHSAGGEKHPGGGRPGQARNEILEHYEQLLELFVGAMERELDQAQRQGYAESPEDRKRRCLAHIGVKSHVLAALDRSFGSPDTVERWRRDDGRQPGDGRRPKSNTDHEAALDAYEQSLTDTADQEADRG